MRPIVASDLMNPDVVTVSTDLSVQALARFLTANQITGAPVVDHDGALAGVVSLVDLAEATSNASAEWGQFLRTEPPMSALEIDPTDLGEQLTVADILTPCVFSVGEDALVSEVASIMMRHHLHRILVLNPDEDVVGIISTSDLLGLLIETT